MKLISGSTMAQVWLEASEHLLTCPKLLDTTVVLHIAEPMRIRKRDRLVADALDEFLIGRRQHSHHTVAETIFPGYEYRRSGSDGVYGYAADVYPAIKSHPDMRKWGTYAHRILSRADDQGRSYSPLKDLIDKMKQRVPVKASYELGLAFDLATYDDDLHRHSRLGGPCLSHISFKLIAQQVHLTAIYRSHYYVHRAYGNLLGLARLQAFVATEVGCAVGPLVCHSTMAQLETGGDYPWAKREISTLIRACRKLYDESSPHSGPACTAAS